MKYLVADLHLAHESIADHRGFESREAHDEAVLASLAALPRNSHLWVLGDVCSGSNGSMRAALDLLYGLDREDLVMHLVAGNHDPCHPMYRDAYKHQKHFLRVFDSVQAFARARVDGVEVLLSHFPYVGDHRDVDRHTQYRLRDEGRWLIHGHTHQAHLRAAHPRQVCVSWEVARRPLSEQEIAQVIREQPEVLQ